ncbi:MAG: hypothetical protein LJE68_15775 [Rhodobacter sp.]|nr:hypothetical protein [Rhodobacter sp.]
MRSTTCTEPGLAALAFCALLPGAALAGPLPTGCFARHYDAAHLAAHPAQVVARIAVDFTYDPRPDFAQIAPGNFGAALDVELAHQGHVTRETAPDEGFATGFGGAQMFNVLLCADHGGKTRCTTPCADGGFTIARDDGATLTLETTALPVGQGQDCGGFTDLIEQPGQPVSYRLTRAPARDCENF